MKQERIDREAAKAGITPLQAYFNLNGIDHLRRNGKLVKDGYRHLLK